MSQLVRLQLEGGSTGPIRAQVVVSGVEEGASAVGQLPSLEPVLLLYQEWRAMYLALGSAGRKIVAEGTGEHEGLSGSYASDPKVCAQKAKQFRRAFDDWLRSRDFVPVREVLLAAFNRDATTRFAICTDNKQLQQLPWVLWDLMALYPTMEVAISTLSYRARSKEMAFPVQGDRVRVMAILGDSTHIDVQSDRQFLSELPGAEVTFLPTPQRTALHDELWNKPVDILFFAGHSYSQDDSGTLQINADEAMSLEEIQHALGRIARHGLTLAIFNSCDGLGLAKHLSQKIFPLGIPYIIVMREAVPDAVAQAFLRYFLAAFSQGEPFHTAVRTARERLENTADVLPPYGEWMPVIWQNPLAEPPVWPQRQAQRQAQKQEIEPSVSFEQLAVRRSKLRVRNGFLASLAVGVGITALRFLGALQGWELVAYDWTLRSRPADPVDSSILVVTIPENELNLDELSSISNRDLEQLFAMLYDRGASVVGLDIIRDRDVSLGLAKYFADGDRLITVCKVAAAGSGEQEIAPSPQANPDGVGFADTSLDKDLTSRRHLMSMRVQPGACSTDYALSTLLAYNYLKQVDAEIELDGGRHYFTWGGRRVPFLRDRSGGYHNSDMGGDTILLNYRMAADNRDPFRRVTLGQVLSGEVPSSWIQDKIVLIGVDAVSVKDSIRTPFRASNGSHLEIPGVVYHAHLTSQLIDGVQGARRFLRPLHPVIDGVLIVLWAGVGCAIVWRTGRNIYQASGMSIAIVVLAGTYYGSFVLIGLWLPLVPCVMSLVGGASLYKIVKSRG